MSAYEICVDSQVCSKIPQRPTHSFLHLSCNSTIECSYIANISYVCGCVHVSCYLPIVTYCALLKQSVCACSASPSKLPFSINLSKLVLTKNQGVATLKSQYDDIMGRSNGAEIQRLAVIQQWLSSPFLELVGLHIR